MTNIPDNTGERIFLEKETPMMISRHLCAYKFCASYADNKTVLDIGCGEGYGTSYLARFAKHSIGIDYNKEVIAYARDKYQKANLEFRCMNAQDIDHIIGQFDIICSFQFIEHLHDVRAFLQKVKNLLNEEGIFICSTPNKEDASPHSATPHNVFHITEYRFDEFKALLGDYFKIEAMYGLKRGRVLNAFRRLKKIGIFNFLSARIDPVKRFYKNIDCRHFVMTTDNRGGALDFFAVCKKGAS